MLVQRSTRPGLTIGVNGLAGNMGVACRPRRDRRTRQVRRLARGFRRTRARSLRVRRRCSRSSRRARSRRPRGALRRAADARRRTIARIFAVDDDRRDLVEPAVQFHDQRQRRAAARAADAASSTIRRRSGLLLALRLRRRVVRAGRCRACSSTACRSKALRRHRRAAGAAVRPRGVRARAGRCIALHDRVHGRGVRRDSFHRRDDRPLRRRSDALSRVSGMRLAVSFGVSSLAVWLLGPVVKAAGFRRCCFTMSGIAMRDVLLAIAAAADGSRTRARRAAMDAAAARHRD